MSDPLISALRDALRPIVFEAVAEAMREHTPAPVAAPEDDTLLSVRGACERLNVSRTTLYEWRRQGRLPELVVGGRIRFRRADVDALIEEPQTI